MVTVFDRGVALVNEFMYLKANVSDTGSCISIIVASSGCKRQNQKEKRDNISIIFIQIIPMNEEMSLLKLLSRLKEKAGCIL